MIIELFGLPGAGKTALAGAIQARGAVLVSLPSRTRLLFDAGMFWLVHPLFAYRLLAFGMRRAPRGMRYALFMNGFLGYAARYRRAQVLSLSGAVAILDQGFFQLCISLDALPLALLKLFPKPDLLVVVTADDSVREARMASRGWEPRDKFGAEHRRAWQQNAKTAFRTALSSLERLVRLYRYDGTRDSQEGAQALMALVTEQMRTIAQSSSLRKAFKTIALFASFLVAQFARVFRRAPQIVVLMYHAIDTSAWKLAVPPEAFERQMTYLARKGWAVPLEDVVSYAKKETKISSRAVAVTFDDGYRDVLETVLPILQRYGVPATVFVPSDLGIRTDPSGRARLTGEELHRLSESPLITIGSHAETHRKFSELSSEEINREARESADALARVLRVRPRFFAYPFGARSAATERAVNDAGYEAAFGITEGTIQQGDSLYCLKRVQIDSTMNFLFFRLRLTAAVDWNRRMVDWLRRH